MTLYDSLITFFVLFVLAIIVYSKATSKTLPEIASEIKEIFSPAEEFVEGGISR